MKYAVALSEQSQYGPTVIAGFVFLPECNLHVWKGACATSAKELCEQVNAGYAALQEYGSPFTTLRVVELEASDEGRVTSDVPKLSEEDEKLISELRGTIARLEAQIQLADTKANREHFRKAKKGRVPKESRIVQLPKGIWNAPNDKEAATG